MKNTLNTIDSFIKNDGLGIKLYTSQNDKLYLSGYNTAILAPTEDGKPNVIDFLHFNMLESLYRFVQNGPSKHVSETVPHFGDKTMFEDVPEIAKFHKDLQQFSTNKEVMFYSEDGKGVTVEIIETRDFQTQKPTQTVLAEIKAENFQELLVKFEQFMQTRLEQEKSMRERRAAASEWSSAE